MNIRAVRQQDISAMLALIRAKAVFDGCLDSLKTTEEAINTAFFSDQPKASALVAEVDGHVIGIATYFETYSSFLARPGLWLDDLYVDETMRGTGAGKALIKALCQIAIDTGCARIDWIVASDNKRGLHFYEGLGAKVFEDMRYARLDEKAIETLKDD